MRRSKGFRVAVPEAADERLGEISHIGRCRAQALGADGWHDVRRHVNQDAEPAQLAGTLEDQDGQVPEMGPISAFSSGFPYRRNVSGPFLRPRKKGPLERGPCYAVSLSQSRYERVSHYLAATMAFSCVMPPSAALVTQLLSASMRGYILSSCLHASTAVSLIRFSTSV